MYQPIETLADHARVWIYAANRPFSTAENTQISDLLMQFTSQWESHGNPLKTSFSVEYSQFIVIAADETQAAASGCSIDKSVGIIRSIEQQFGLTLLDRGMIAYYDGQAVQTTNLASIKQQIIRGEIHEDTLIFNNLVATLGGWRSEWLRPAAETWVKRLLTERV